VKLIDTHAHLDEIEDIDGALKRAKDFGLQAIIGVGSDFVSNQKILALASRYPGYIFPALGLHPWRLEREDLEGSFAFIEENLPQSLALGEIGLDFAIQTSKEKQDHVLQKLLGIASRGDKPVLLHARRAWAETLKRLREFGIRRAVFHWYSGPGDVLHRLLNEGYLISATPAAIYSERHRQALKEAPLSQILLETDAPEIYQEKVSEPIDLLISLRALSEIKGMPAEEVAEQVLQNSVAFFNLDPKSMKLDV
jgi:TatD DNase family protein